MSESLPPLRDLLATATDSDLADAVIRRIDRHYPDRSLKVLSKPERIVYCAYVCTGIIGNGGFRYLLEAPFEGDPRLKYAFEAFKALDCPEAITAFRQTFAVFPDGFPPKDIKQRMKIYLKAMRKWPTDEDLLFFKATPYAAIGRYIRARQEAFDHLDHDPVAIPLVEDAPAESESEPDPMALLPRWSRVAYAVHLGWEVFPFLRTHWPEIPVKYMARVRVALETAERSVYEHVEEAELHSADCTGVVGAALSMMGGKEGAPADGILAAKAANAARTAAMAVRTATGKNASSIYDAWQARESALAAVPDRQRKQFESDWNADYIGLSGFVRQKGWGDRKKMPKDLWQQVFRFMAES